MPEVPEFEEPQQDDLETNPADSDDMATDDQRFAPPLAEPEVFEDEDDLIQVDAAEAVDEKTEVTVPFDDLTLAEVVAQFARAPLVTWRALVAVAQTPTWTQAMPSASQTTQVVTRPVSVAVSPTSARSAGREGRKVTERVAIRLGMYLLAFLLAWWGSGILVNAPTRTEAMALDVGAPFLLAGFVVWLLAELFGDWPHVVNWWRGRGADKPVTAAEEMDNEGHLNQVWLESEPASLFFRLVAVLGGIFLSLFAWRLNSGNQFTTIGFWAWMLSIVAWGIALAPPGWRLPDALEQVLSYRSERRVRGNWTLWALVLIVLLGAVFRLTDLPGMLPEMTSDHVEKLLDSQRVLEGQHQIFFPNNGGREPVQMYLMAWFSQLPGLGMNFTTLKLLSIIEGLITLPVLWWMGREVIGAQDRRLGNLVGLLLAGLVAASYWHTMLSRLALRIVMTPLVTALLAVYLSRAMRHNRRADFIKAGLVLGFGLYTYQAVRMLPVVVLLGIGLAFLFWSRSMRDRGRYVLNLLVLIVMSFVVFVPLFGFSIDPAVQGPEHFWKRTAGRLLGDDVIQTTDAAGNIVQRNASMAERIEAFNSNVPVLLNNIRNALLMYNWKGDVAWINGAPNRPAMDTITGALLIVGLAAWLAHIVRQRDVVALMIPLMVFIMLLPSALSIAYPIENPSATRTSGSLPGVYLIAALPLALMAQLVMRIASGRAGKMIAGVLSLLVILGVYVMNSSLYFGIYRENYIISSLPYSEGGRVLRGFAESDGAYGNAFMIAYPYWWDHRALGLEAGLTDWPNGIPGEGQKSPVHNMPEFLYDTYQRNDAYRFDTEKDILFFYSSEDVETERRLEQWFPEGRSQLISTYQIDDEFKLFRVPWLGEDGFQQFLIDTGVTVG